MVILRSLSFACFLLMDDCPVRHSDPGSVKPRILVGRAPARSGRRWGLLTESVKGALLLESAPAENAPPWVFRSIYRQR